MAGGNVITKGASKMNKTSKTGTRAGGNVITKGPTKKKSKAGKSKSSKKR